MLDLGTVALLLLALIAVVWLVRSIVRVPRGFTFTVDRLGRFQRALPPGTHLLLPAIERVRLRIPDTEETLDLPQEVFDTGDDQTVILDCQVRYRVVDPAAASNVRFGYSFGLHGEVECALEHEIEPKTLAETLAARTEIESCARSFVERAAPRLGLRVTEFEIRRLERFEEEYHTG